MLYFPLSPRTSHVRLLVLHPGYFDDQISCGLIHLDLDRSPLRKFEALSYTWGDPCDCSPILLKGQDFRVTKNLEAALRNLRPVPIAGDGVGQNSRYLWVDAICINQQDQKERSEQVLRIPKIYKAADTTVVWLGEGTAESNKAMDFMNQTHRRAFNMESDLLQAGNYREEYLALVRGLLIRPWWQRMWIVQEVAVSNYLAIACGSKTVTWPLLIRFVSITHLYHKPAVAEILRQVDAEEVRNSNLGVKLFYTRGEWRKSGPQALFRLAMEFRSFKATIPADKIYGLLGMAAEANHPALKPDYSNLPQEVFKTVTRFAIEQQQNLNPICIATGPRRLADLPSWTPDFTVPAVELASPLKGALRLLDRYLYSAARDISMAVSFSDDSNIMYAEGIRADFVDRLAPYWDPQRPIHDFSGRLPILAWLEVLKPVIADIGARYGPGFPLQVAMVKILTADRVTDSKWNISRFEPDKSWSDLPTEPPEDWTDEGTAEEQLDQWEDAKRHMVEGALTQRRFMVTKSGYIGLVPQLTEVGDIICALFGCDTPLVLRPINDHYILIGECYVHGLMDGELVDGLRDGRASKERFEVR